MSQEDSYKRNNSALIPCPLLHAIPPSFGLNVCYVCLIADRFLHSNVYLFSGEDILCLSSDNICRQSARRFTSQCNLKQPYINYLQCSTSQENQYNYVFTCTSTELVSELVNSIVAYNSKRIVAIH